jgi:hypothetical protein
MSDLKKSKRDSFQETLSTKANAITDGALRA